MGRHEAVRGEEGTYTHKTRKTVQYDGKHREGVAKGSSGQQSRTTKSDIPHRDGRTDK
jgi:hypothetical protein